jgi:magnesium transporter
MLKSSARLKAFGRRSKQIGLAPGSVVYSGEFTNEPISIDLFRVEADVANYERAVTLDNAIKITDDELRWIDVFGIHNTRIIRRFGEAFQIHNLTLEDIVNPEHRAKVEVFDDYLYVVLRMLWLKDGRLEDEQLSFILQDGLVMSFQERQDDIFDPIRQRLTATPARFYEGGAGYLLYSLIDIVVDTYLLVLDHYDMQLEALEDTIVSAPRRHTLDRITTLRRDLITLRRALKPLTSMMHSLISTQSGFLNDDTKAFLRDVSDHTNEASDRLEALREQLSNLHELYVTTLSIKMNEVMQVLTVISTIFIPLSFLVGVYGMNFQTMPELTWDWGYFVLWAFMLTIAVVMLVMFRKNDWL